jgi:uncharacterized membrane protein
MRLDPDALTRLPSPARLEAFSDGVLAIAITLLILEVRIPDYEPGHLDDALLKQWPSYATYVLTFAVIGVMWVNHHGLFRVIVRVNRPVMYLNLAILMGIAFLPFPTSLFSHALQTPDLWDQKIAAFVYSLNLVVISFTWLATWLYLSRRIELLDGFDRGAAVEATRRVAVGPVIYVVAALLAFVGPYLCLVAHAVVAVYFIGSGERGRAPTPVG